MILDEGYYGDENSSLPGTIVSWTPPTAGLRRERDTSNGNRRTEEELSISANSSCSPLSSFSKENQKEPTRADTAVAVKMSTLQASFAEKTAEEMKQIVNWYAINNEKDRFVKVNQRKSLPGNAMACFDYQDDEAVKDAGGANELTPPKAQHASEDNGIERLQVAVVTPPKKSQADIQADESTSLPDLALSPASSADKSLNCRDHYNENGSDIDFSFSKEAEVQNQAIKNLLEATRFMAEIVLEYELISSGSERDSTSKAANTKTNPVPRKKTQHQVGGSHTEGTSPAENHKSRQRRKIRMKKKAKQILGMGALGLVIIATLFFWYGGRPTLSQGGCPAARSLPEEDSCFANCRKSGEQGTPEEYSEGTTDEQGKVTCDAWCVMTMGIPTKH